MNANDNTPPASASAAMAEAAEAFLVHRNLVRRSPGSRPLLVDRCARYLGQRFGLVPIRAAGIAKRAAAEVIRRHGYASFDLAASSAEAVVLVDPVKGTRRTLTVADALRRDRHLVLVSEADRAG